MAVAEAPSEKFARGRVFVAVVVFALFAFASCRIAHNITAKDSRGRDRSHTLSVAAARTFAGDLATNQGSELRTCFRVVPPATDPAEVTCPKYPTP